MKWPQRRGHLLVGKSVREMMKRFEGEIEKIVAGGDGLARHEGRVVFVLAENNRADYLR